MSSVARFDHNNAFLQEESLVLCTDLGMIFDDRDVDVDFLFPSSQNSCLSSLYAPRNHDFGLRDVSDERNAMLEPLDLSLTDLLGIGDEGAANLLGSPQDVNAFTSIYSQFGEQESQIFDRSPCGHDIPDLANLIEGVLDGNWDDLQILVDESVSESENERRVSLDFRISGCPIVPLNNMYAAHIPNESDSNCNKAIMPKIKSDGRELIAAATYISTKYISNDNAQSGEPVAMPYDLPQSATNMMPDYMAPMYYNPAAVTPLPYGNQTYSYTIRMPSNACAVSAPSASLSSVRRPKQCVVDNCVRRAQSNNRCKSHGGGARCQMKGCEKSSQGGGLCRAHGGGKKCGVPGCTKGTQRLGLCYLHGGIRRCLTDGCKKKDRGNGYCISHGGGRRCQVTGCRRSVRKGNHCQAHQVFEDLEL